MFLLHSGGDVVAIETLTTVGYGDMVPATAVGKILGGIVSIVGIGTLALFSGVITVGFWISFELAASRPSVRLSRPAPLPTARTSPG